jgi:predicted MFS family arabinose efflux permease
MTARELRASFSLAALAGLRMLGMFIVLPIFGLYAEQLRGGGSHALIGLALGAYGLTQALLQIPFGALSDRWGRKRTIYIGLLLLALGSFVAAAAADIYVMILGRVLQGAGAISAAVIALAADLTRDEQRTKAMAIIGMTIGATFSLSLIAGPVLGRALGVPGVFAMTGGLALAALAVARWVVPDPPPAVPHHESTQASSLLGLLRNPDLVRMNWGIAVLHAVLMALFVVLPFALRDAGLPASRHWQIYLPVMAASVLVMVPPLLISERRGKQKPVLLGAIGVLLGAEIVLAATLDSVHGIAVVLVAFFAAFNLLEASLPSLVTKLAPAEAKGAAAGMYSSAQFLGTFLGAAAGGLVSQFLGTPAVLALCGLLTLSWLLVAWPMSAPAPVGVRT